MKSARRKMFWIAALSGAIGGGFGAASGSNSMFIVVCVGIVISLLVAWSVSGMLK